MQRFRSLAGSLFLLARDFLGQNFALFSSDEPRVERVVFEQVDNHDVEKDNRADFGEATDDIVTDLLNALLNHRGFLLEQVHRLVQLGALHLFLYFMDGQPDKSTTQRPAHLVEG